MQLSRGAKLLFEHLQYLALLPKGAIKFQSSLAKYFTVTTRTIRRWLTELVAQGLRIIRRGRTSARYEVASVRVDILSTQETQNVHSRTPYLLTESFKKREQFLPRKQPQRETLYERLVREGFGA